MFHLKLNDGREIPLKWGYFAIKLLSKRMNLDPTQYFNSIATGAFIMTEIDKFLLTAHEFACMSLGVEYKEPTEFEICQWIDEAGLVGDEAQIPKFLDYVIGTHVVNTTNKEAKDEKKN